MTPDQEEKFRGLRACWYSQQISAAEFRRHLDDDPEFAAWYRRTAAEPVSPQTDPVVDAVRADLLQRSQLGIKKYGVTLARTDLNLRDWLQHAYEETLDQANYLKRAIIELEPGNAEN